MSEIGQVEQPHVTSVDIDGKRYNVTVRTAFDGIEHVGHLWFADADWDDDGIRDHGTIPGRNADDVLSNARALDAHELGLRYKRALADKRRYHGLRKITEDVLNDIRHLNKVAMSMRAGLLAIEEAAAEINSTEERLHEMVARLKHYAGVTA